MVESDKSISLINEVWVNVLNRYVKIQNTITKYVIGALHEGMNCMVTTNSDTTELYELAILGALCSLNSYKYPQAVIVVKE